MALPPQVQAQADAADRLLNEMNAPTAPTTPEPNVEQSANPPQPESKEQAEPLQEAAPTQPPQPAKPDPWEAKYRTLQGLFNKTVPELQEEVKNLKANLSKTVERLDQTAKPVQEQPRVAEPKDIDDFGAELVDMVGRVAQGVFAQAAARYDAQAVEMNKRFDELNRQMSGTTETLAVSAEQAFFDRVTKLVPNWEQINADPAFLAWLADADPVYGVPRQNAMNAAQQTLNPERAAAVFNAFAPPQKAAAPKADPLDKQVSPRGAAGNSAPVQPSASVVTQKFITQFYREVQQGKYRGSEAKAAQIEQEINSALAEGRVQ